MKKQEPQLWKPESGLVLVTRYLSETKSSLGTCSFFFFIHNVCAWTKITKEMVHPNSKHRNFWHRNRPWNLGHFNLIDLILIDINLVDLSYEAIRCTSLKCKIIIIKQSKTRLRRSGNERCRNKKYINWSTSSVKWLLKWLTKIKKMIQKWPTLSWRQMWVDDSKNLKKMKVWEET